MALPTPSDSPPEPHLGRLSQFVNPYDKPQSELVRSQVWVDPVDKALLHSVFPLRGLETILLAGIYKSVCADFRKENLTSYSPSNARRAQQIISCKLTALCPSGEGRESDDTRGSDSVQQPRADDAHVPTNLHETTPGRRGGGGGGRGKRRGAEEGKDSQKHNQKTNRRKRVSGESQGSSDGSATSST